MTGRWRTGRSLGRTLYIGDRLVGLMDSVALADEVVAAVNAYAEPGEGGGPVLGDKWSQALAAILDVLGLTVADTARGEAATQREGT